MSIVFIGHFNHFPQQLSISHRFFYQLTSKNSHSYFKSYLISGPFKRFCCYCAIIQWIIHFFFQLNFIRNWYRPYFRRSLYIYIYLLFFFFFSLHFVHNHIRNSIMFFSDYCSKIYDLRFIRPDAIWRSKYNSYVRYYFFSLPLSSFALFQHIFIKWRSMCFFSFVVLRRNSMFAQIEWFSDRE